MAGAKEIRGKISSIQNTQKITRAMEMVAASKMRRAQERMAASRPYADKMIDVIGHLAHANPEYRHPYMITSDQVQKVGYVVVTTDRGLCGGLNVNLFRALTRDFKEKLDAGQTLETCAIGRKGVQFLKRTGSDVVAQAQDLGDQPSLDDMIGPVKAMLESYDEGRIQELHLVHNRFVNTMTQKPVIRQLLPLAPAETDAGDDKELAKELEHMQRTHWDYIYEPDAREVLDALLQRYIEALVYQGVVENVACEMAARMIAMKSASDNADSLIDDLRLAYNKARQAAITQELSEIVGGAAAVS
ncbi:MAG: F0F1 ATP synthase subunit gamma [Halofilum sp. (in: g-proteobacteria)]|nr:F0F1 ATP synthase subunit gamma [Halofilum sp. (in: g-proteobacteria)]